MRRLVNRRSSFFAIATIAIVLVWMMLGWHRQISSYMDDEKEKSLPHKEVNAQEKKVKSTVKKMLIPIEKRTGLTAKGNRFKLNGQDIVILSGAVHYFRIPKKYWKDRLEKMKDCGLNTVETYVPWNLHEPLKNTFNFNGNLNLVEFITVAQEMGFYVILRPGPYICAEWEFGGLPSWLLRDPKMSVRSTYGPYLEHVKSYFSRLLPLVSLLQYTKGGPIIAFQIENEYGSFYKEKAYLEYLKTMMEGFGINELLFTSDNSEGLEKLMPNGVLRTANFKSVDNHIEILNRIQPDAPQMVMELWSGWFDTWDDKHHTLSATDFKTTVEWLLSHNVSINFYMFHGGTNFGFMNGAMIQDNKYTSDITSYDYDCPISESGELTEKYFVAKQLIAQFNHKEESSKKKNEIPVTAYEEISIVNFLPLWNVLSMLPSFNLKPDALNMEMFPINKDNGQSYGYALYTTELTVPKDKLVANISGFQNVSDRVQIFIDQKCKMEMLKEKPKFWLMKTEGIEKATVKFDMLVENGGRVNWKNLDDQRKGMVKPLSIDGKEITLWSAQPLEMKQEFISHISALNIWSSSSAKEKVPGFSRTYLEIKDEPKDTFINMVGWQKGVVFINGENLGRYWQVGPQCTLYLPATWLRKGTNEIMVFEEVSPSSSIKFESAPIWGTPACTVK